MSEAAQSKISQLLEKGLQHYGMGEPERALELWQQVLELDPSNIRANEYIKFVGAPAPVPEQSGDTPGNGAGSVDEAASEAGEPTSRAGLDGAHDETSDEQPADVQTGVVSQPEPVKDPPADPDPLSMSWGEMIDGSKSGETQAQASPARPAVPGLPLATETSETLETLGTETLAVETLAVETLGTETLAADEPEPEIQAAGEMLSSPAVTPQAEPSLAASNDVLSGEGAEVHGAAAAETVQGEAAGASGAEKGEQAATAAEPSDPWDAGPSATETVNLVANDEASHEFLDTVSAEHDIQEQKDAATPAIDDGTEPPVSEGQSTHADLESLMKGALDLFELGDFSGSLDLVEKVLQTDPDFAQARDYLERNQETLLQMYESKIGSFLQVPRVAIPPDEVIWLNLHHRAGFLLAQIDGTLSYEDILALSPMSKLETCKILVQLIQEGVIQTT